MIKKIFVLMMMAIVLVMMTGCIQNDIGVELNTDGTGSISTTIGIEKDCYQSIKQVGSDPFEGKITTEYTYEGTTYVAYTEVKEYCSFEAMERALLEMTYDTEMIEDAQQAQNDESVIPETDNHIFSSVNIEKNGGIFYSSYTFNAVLNPQSNYGLDYDMNDAFKVTLTVEMPDEITQFNGGKVEGNKITFDVEDITESREFGAISESNNTGIVIGIVIGLILIVAVFFCIVKLKK